MQQKLNSMLRKASFEGFYLTENGSLEIQGRNHKIVDNFFLYDGSHYYFGNQDVKLSSNSDKHRNLILAMTDTKLLIPQDNEEYQYIARNHPANSDLLIVVLYYHNGYSYFSVVSGCGSGRVHPTCLPLTKEGFHFCFHCAIEAIATTNPELTETLFTFIKDKTNESKERITEHSIEGSKPDYLN